MRKKVCLDIYCCLAVCFVAHIDGEGPYLSHAPLGVFVCIVREENKTLIVIFVKLRKLTQQFIKL